MMIRIGKVLNTPTFYISNGKRELEKHFQLKLLLLVYYVPNLNSIMDVTCSLKLQITRNQKSLHLDKTEKHSKYNFSNANFPIRSNPY